MDYKHTKESCADDGENITMVYKSPWEYERLVRYEITILDQYQKECIIITLGQFEARRRKRNLVASSRPLPECPIKMSCQYNTPHL